MIFRGTSCFSVSGWFCFLARCLEVFLKLFAAPAWRGALGFRPVFGYCGFCFLVSVPVLWGVLFFQSQALHSCASLHVSVTSFHDRRVLQGCEFFLSYMACATSFCFVCRVLCVSCFHFRHSLIQARLPALAVLGCGCLRRVKSAKPKC